MSHNVNQNNILTHPYYLTYSDFQKPYNYWTPQNNGNNDSTSFTNMKGEFPFNSNYRYAIGYNVNDRYITLFNINSIKFMSQAISQLLHGVHPEGKNIVVPDSTIKSVADSVYQNTWQDVNVMQQMIISIIVDDIKTDYANTTKNNNLSIWVTKYDQDSGLSQFNDVKLNNKMRSPYLQFRY